jgi:hypothetical protein
MPERDMQITAAAAAAKKHGKAKKKAAAPASDDESDGDQRPAPGAFVGGINAPRDANAYASAGSSSDDEAPKQPRKSAKASTSTQGRRLGGDSDDGRAVSKAKSGNKSINTSSPEKPKGKAKAYCPRVQTGGWAILVGLCSFGSGEWKSQADITRVGDPFYGKPGQSLSDKGSGSGKAQFITAWRGVSYNIGLSARSL